MAKLIGRQQVSFTDSAGKQVEGYSLFFVENVPSSNGDGYRFVCGRSQGKTKTSTLFLSKEDYSALGLVVGKEYNLLFNQYGQIMRDFITPLK